MKKTTLLLLFSWGYFQVLAQSYTSTTISGINEIAGTGTPVTLTASQSSSTSSGELQIGFAFNFYGNAYTSFYINPTGTISFGSANQNYLEAYYAPQNIIPSTNVPNNFIGFAFINPFDNYPQPNLYPNYSGANINYFVSGTSPNRILVVNFKNVVIPGSFPIPTRTLNVQTHLYESDGKIEVHNTTNSAPFSANYYRFDYLQIGVENIDGTNGTAATCPANWNLNNTTVRFVYCPNPIPSGVTPNTGICNGISQQTINLNASCSYGTVTWYKDDGSCVSTSGTLLTSTSVTPTVTTTYKVRCEDATCNSGFVSTKITVTNSIPSVPSTITKSPNTTVNAGTNVTLSTSCNSGYYKWEDNSTNPTRVVTPSQTTTYSVKCINGACESANVSTTVNVNVPPPTISSPVTNVCSGTSATLTAAGCLSPDIVTWYQSGVGNIGTGLTKTVSFTTTNVSAISNISASCTKNAVESFLSNYVYITVYGIPAAPSSITKTPNTSVNANSNVTLTATCTSGNTIKWENNSTTNPRIVTPAVTTTYSAKCVNSSCESATSTSTTVTVLGPPVISSSANPVCAATYDNYSGFNPFITLTAEGCPVNVVWTSIPANAPKPTGNSGNLSNYLFSENVTYTAFCSSTGFTSASFILNYEPNAGTVSTTPSIITTLGQTINLSFTGATGGTLTWYANNGIGLGNNGSPVQIATGTNTTQNIPSTSTEYYVSRQINGCNFTSTKKTVPFQLTLSGTGNAVFDVNYNEGGTKFSQSSVAGSPQNVAFPSSYIDANTKGFNAGITTSSCGFGGGANCWQGNFIVRKQGVWEIKSFQSDQYGGVINGTTFYHTKFKYDTQRPPCTAIWIKDADNTEQTLSMSGVCTNTPSITAITFDDNKCDGDQISISFTTASNLAPYKVQLVYYGNYQFFFGGPGDTFSNIIQEISTNSSTATLTIPTLYQSTGCKTTSSQSRCDYYKIRIVPTGFADENGVGKEISLKTTTDCVPPCLQNRVFTSTVDDVSTGVVIKQANVSNGKITATNKITGTAKATYQAKMIELNAGFKADNGTVFKAEIGGCQ